MTKVKKTIIVVLLALACFFGGLCGVLLTKADAQNPLAVRYRDGKQTTAFLGESVRAAKATPVYPDKVSRVSYTVQTPDGDTFVVDGQSFTPDSVGEYTVFVCVVGNDGETYVESYTVTVTKSETPILTKAPLLPTAFIEGFEYDVPEAEFVDYNEATPKAVSYDVYYVDQNGAEQKVTDSFSPTVDLHGETVALKYTATSSVTDKTASKIFKLPVLKAISENEFGDKLFDYQNMFVTEGVSSSELTADGCVFYASNDFGVSYANFVNADGWSLGLKAVKGMGNFSSVRITLTDVADVDSFVTLDVSAIDENSSKVVINSETTKTVKGSVLNEETGVWFTFENDTLKLYDTDYKLVATIATTGNGDLFEGFASSRISVSVEAKTLTAKSALMIYELNGQPFNSENTTDTIKPIVITEKDTPIRYAVGDTVVVPKAFAVDTIDPTVRATVTVTDGETGLPVTAKDGTVLNGVAADKEYTFVADKLGSYNVQYNAEDISGWNTRLPSYTLFVRDEKAPEVNVSSAIQSTVKLGGKINIPKFTYTDDYSTQEEMTTLVTVSVADGNFEVVKAGDTFTFNAVGFYHIRFTVIDAYFNMTTVEYVVECV